MYILIKANNKIIFLDVVDNNDKKNQKNNMAKNNNVFNIIKSLSMNEKRYFKIYCKQHILNGKNKYVLLFDLIDSQKVFDYGFIKNELKKLNYTIDNFSSDINYLKKILLKSLNEYHTEKTTDLKIKKNLITIEILFYKGLYEECLQLISKTKKIKLANENNNLLFDLFNWEKKCVGYSKGFSSVNEINYKLEVFFDEIKEKKTITDLYYKSYYFKNSIGKIKQEKLFSDFYSIVIIPLENQTFELTTLQSKVLYNLIYANFYKVKNEKENELIYLKKASKIYDENDSYKHENPLDFISIYIRIIDINKKKDSEVFYKDLTKLKEFNTFTKIQSKVAEKRILIHTNQLELEHLLYFNKTKEAFICLEALKRVLSDKHLVLEPFYIISNYYLLTVTYILSNNFSQALKYVNKILNDFSVNQNPKHFIQAEFLNIVIHYELKNYDLALKHIYSLEKKYKQNYKFNYFEIKILDAIIKITKNKHIVHEKKVFIELKKEIYNKYTASQLINNNYLKYINSKSI